MNHRDGFSAPAASALAAAQTRFAFRLLVALAGEKVDRNLLISPSGLAFALALLYGGAAGSTQDALRAVLDLPGWSVDEMNHAAQALQRALRQSGPDLELSMASGLWIARGLVLAPEYCKQVEAVYKAAARNLDFSSPGAIQEVNTWVSQMTCGKITELLDQTDFTAKVDFILTNAVYFKGLWATPFDPRQTRGAPFTLPGGRQKNVPMMSRIANYGYAEVSDCRVVSLPYAGGTSSLYLFLPHEQSSLEQLMNRLATTSGGDWLPPLQQRLLSLAVPHFSHSYQADLKAPLSALGMGIAFTPGADFRPMGWGGHHITQVKHQARAEVREEGTEASAGTAVLMARSLIRALPLTFNRPFFFVIQEHTTGAPLFMGVVVDPE